MSRRPSPWKPEKPKSEVHEHQSKYLVQCSNCHYKVRRNEIFTLEPCKHNVCEDCLDREETDSQGEYVCPICGEPSIESETPEPSRELSNEDDIESLNGKDQESLNARDRESMSEIDQESLNGKDRESFNGKDQESLNAKDEESLNGIDQESLNGKDRESFNGKDQESLNGKDRESLNGKKRESLNTKDEESMNGKDQESLNTKDEESLNTKDEESLNGKDQKPLTENDQDTLSGRDEEKDEELNNTSDTKLPTTPKSIQEHSKENDEEFNDNEETTDIATSRQIYLTGIDEEDHGKGNKDESPQRQQDSKILKGGRESKPFCHRHYQDKVWYCLDCDNPMCKLCSRSDYHPRNHRLKNLEEVTQLMRSNAAQAREAIQGELMPVMHQSLKYEESYKKNLPKRLETLRELVERQATSIVRLVDELKARTIEDLEHYAFQTDKVMYKRLIIMNKQLQAAKDESQLLSDVEDATDADVVKTHKRLQEFFVRSKEGNFSSFYLHNRSRPDFNVMATVTSSYSDYELPRELVDAVRRHVGWAIEGPPVLVNDTRHTPEYPLMQRGFRVPISQFPACLSQTKKLIMEWRKFAKMK